MALRRLCKSAKSGEDEECEAVYVDDDDPATMIAQGKRLTDGRTAEFIQLADDETGAALPTETVLRAVGLFLAERGRPAVLAEVEDYLAEAGL